MPSSFCPRFAAAARACVAEERLGTDVLDELAAAVTTSDVGPWSLGRLSAARRPADGLLVAAANPRGMQGYAVGR